MTEANANTRSAPTRPNYFILLGLKPDEPLDDAKIEEVIREKRIEWSNAQKLVGQKALVAQNILSYIPDIRAVLGDFQQRQVEQEAARGLFASEIARRREEFEKQIGFINAKDAVDQKELEKFILDFKDIYTKEEITGRIRPTLASPGEKTDHQQGLEPTLVKSIDERLVFINKTSLYDFLWLPDATGTAELGRVATELYQREVQRMPKTAEVTARTELAGHAKQLFSADSTRRQYDESLRQASINRLLTDLEVIMSRVSNKELQAGQVKLFLENARQAGWERDEAYTHLLERARTRKWFLAPTEVERQICCPNPACRALTGSDKKYCNKCGTELHIICPNCGEPVESGERICDHCRFEVGNRFRVVQLLDEVRKLAGAGRSGDALNTLRVLDDLWKPGLPDELRKSIDEQKVALEAAQKQREAAQKTVEEEFLALMSAKKFYTARGLLQKHPDQEAAIVDIAVHKATIYQKLAKAEAERRKLEKLRHTLTPDDHIARYLDIEEICQDMPGMSGLRIPPPPPGDLRAQVRGTIVSLSWQPSPTQAVGIVYTGVRKERARPSSVQDGQECINNLASCVYDDDTASVGVPVYYAVYSGYSSIKSATAAVLLQPVLVTQSVRAVQARAGNQQVDLSWETPPNADTVIVVRKEQSAPTSLSDGVRVGEYRPSQTELTDHAVQNGQTYYYAFYCQFKDENGDLVSSAAECIATTPAIPPQPLQHLNITSKRLASGEYEVKITWEQVARGRVEIKKTPQPFPLPSGSVKPEYELLAYGERLVQYQDQVIEKWPKPGVAYYTPIVFEQGMGYVGASRHFACVETLTDLEILNLGDKLRFKWKWPLDCQEVRVAYSKLGWPESGIEDIVEERVSRAKYERQGGCWYLAGTLDQEYYVGLTAVVLVDTKPVIGQEIRSKVRQRNLLEVDYEIRRSGILHSRPELYITVNRLEDLPGLVLVARRDRLPANKNDGDRLEIPAQRLRKRAFPVHLLGMKNAAPGSFVKLFLEDDAMTDRVRINTPAREKLRLN